MCAYRVAVKQASVEEGEAGEHELDERHANKDPCRVTAVDRVFGHDYQSKTR